MLGAIKLNLRKLVVFNLLSLADFFLTWHLLRKGGGQIYESNPVANAWLSSYGWVGLLIFKVSMVLLIGVLAVIISFHRPRTSDRILMFACLVTGGVVAYSFYLANVLVQPPSGMPFQQTVVPRARTLPGRATQSAYRYRLSKYGLQDTARKRVQTEIRGQPRIADTGAMGVRALTFAIWGAGP